MWLAAPTQASTPEKAASQNTLLDAGVSDFEKLSRIVLSLVAQRLLGSASNFCLRGVGTSATKPLGDRPVVFSFDRVYIEGSTATGTINGPEQVEALEGPQGTLYGRNATGSAINVIGDYLNQDARRLGSVRAPSPVVQTAPPIRDRIASANPRSIAEPRSDPNGPLLRIAGDLSPPPTITGRCSRGRASRRSLSSPITCCAHPALAACA